jgi:nucleoside-diphosphate-sugar epimerase
VYVGGTSYYGDQGTELVTEDASPNPRGWGRFLAPAIDQLEGFAARGLDVVLAYPGYVYGDGSWFRQYVLLRLRAGKKIVRVSGPSRYGSPIHVHDCARALVHLLGCGEAGRRYFVVDDEPVEIDKLLSRAAGALGETPRYRRVPAWLLPLLVGRLSADGFKTDSVLSNARLKSTGFTLRFPTSATGVPDVIAHARPS